MDYEYLQNVLGSPYVNEGAFDRLKAKGAQAMGSLGAIAGHQIQTPAETKLKSLWGGFIGSLEQVMTDWKTRVSPMLGPDVKLDATSRQIRKSLDALAQTLTPYEVGAYSSSVKPNPSSLKTLAKEGMFDSAKRNMALTSNNPSSIVNTYKNQVLGLFRGFMKDAIKMTKLPVQQIYNTLAKMQPNQAGWQAAGNIQKVVKQLQRLQGVQKPAANNVPPVLQPSTPGNVPPVLTTSPFLTPPIPTAMTSTAPAAPAAAALKPTTPTPTPTPTASASTPSPFTPSASTSAATTTPISGPTSHNNVVENGFEIPPQELPYVILTALNIIIDAAKSDTAHALGLFGVDPNTKSTIPVPNISTEWGSGASVTSSLQEAEEAEDETPETPATPTAAPAVATPPAAAGNYDLEAKKKEDDAWIHKEYPGMFLYNFRSRHNKYPAQPFSIQVVGTSASPNVVDNTGAVIGTVDVWWQSEDTFNKIYVVEVKNGKKSKPTLILRFSDHHVSAKSGATTPGNPNFFDLDAALAKTNSTANISGNPQVKSAIDKIKDNLFRALLATTHGKTMEFRSKGWEEKKAMDKANAKADKEAPSATIDGNGTYSYLDSDTNKQVVLSKNQLKNILKGPLTDASMMRNKLTKAGYFEKFPDMPVTAMMTPIWKQARQVLVSKGYTPNKSDVHLTQGFQHIKDFSPNASIWPDDATLSVDDLVAAALKQKPQPKESPETEVGKIPAALDAAMALVAMGEKKNDAFELVAQAIKSIGPDKTMKDYISASKAKPKPTNAPTSTNPTTSNPVVKPQTPKFKVGDTVETGNKTFVIKSISPDNVVVSGDNGTEFSVSVTQWNEWEQSGAIKAAKPKVSGAAGGPPAASPVSAPASGQSPSKTPSAPVSDAGKQQAAAQSPQAPKPTAGKISVQGDKLVWTVGQNVQPLDVGQVKAMLKNPEFKAAVKANPDVYQKFKGIVDKGNKPKKKKTQEGIDFINPFRWENLV